MSGTVAAIVLIFLAAFSEANIFHPEKWNGLRTTWGLNPFSSINFQKQPRKETDAREKGWTLKYNFCGSEPGPFVGKGYWKDSDSAVVLIFDCSDGFIAGIQTMVPKSKYTPPMKAQGTSFTSWDEYWVLTAYFLNPSKIREGRGSSDFERDGTGTDLYIQNGTNSEHVFRVPKSEDQIKKTLWGRGKCFWTMGKHYWFNIRDDMDCEEFFPYCLLYNGGKLDAFCFAFNTEVDTSSHYEHPSGKDAKKCCMDTPKCFFDNPQYSGKQTTMHVYMNNSPRTSTC